MEQPPPLWAMHTRVFPPFWNNLPHFIQLLFAVSSWSHQYSRYLQWCSQPRFYLPQRCSAFQHTEFTAAQAVLSQKKVIFLPPPQTQPCGGAQSDFVKPTQAVFVPSSAAHPTERGNGLEAANLLFFLLLVLAVEASVNEMLTNREGVLHWEKVEQWSSSSHG